uniref:Putative ovule protein n=1 Tax=Solanum chacoense TaxID=4108 RepID=A0A0V0H4N4_SOLCH
MSLFTRRAPPLTDIRVCRVLFPPILFSCRSTILTSNQVPIRSHGLSNHQNYILTVQILITDRERAQLSFLSN